MSAMSTKTFGDTHMRCKLISGLMTGMLALPMPLLAAICPPSNAVNVIGIGDGCSTSYDGVNLGVLIPDVGIFRSTFTPACDFHDKCYTLLGTDYGECDREFLSRMKSKCDSDFKPWLLPAENTACTRAATEYYGAVNTYRKNFDPNLEKGFQKEALGRSRQLQADVNGDVCGTEPVRTTLYAAQLITKVNNAFLANTGRTPTLYEFLDAVNFGSLVEQPAEWEANLYANAALAAYVQPPAVNFSITKPPRGDDGLSVQPITFAVAPAVSGVSYLWTIRGNAFGPQVTYSFASPAYNTSVQFSGYLKATNSAGVRNMALIETTFNLKGYCGSSQRKQCN